MSVKVSRSSLDHAYKGLYNALVRHDYELTENKRLLEKEQRAESMISTFREQGATEKMLAEVGGFYVLMRFIFKILTLELLDGKILI